MCMLEILGKKKELFINVFYISVYCQVFLRASVKNGSKTLDELYNAWEVLKLLHLSPELIFCIYLCLQSEGCALNKVLWRTLKPTEYYIQTFVAVNESGFT